MNGLIEDLADALEETRAGTNKRHAKLVAEARAITRGPLKVTAVGMSGTGKTEALDLIEKMATSLGCQATFDSYHSRECVEFGSRHDSAYFAAWRHRHLVVMSDGQDRPPGGRRAAS